MFKYFKFVKKNANPVTHQSIVENATRGAAVANDVLGVASLFGADLNATGSVLTSS